VATVRNRAHIVPMADTSPPPVVQIKESKDGTWDVTVSWHSGRIERLGNFQTEPEARKWGQSHILKWLDARRANDNG
jgi:hypothetical protein